MTFLSSSLSVSSDSKPISLFHFHLYCTYTYIVSPSLIHIQPLDPALFLFLITYSILVLFIYLRVLVICNSSLPVLFISLFRLPTLSTSTDTDLLPLAFSPILHIAAALKPSIQSVRPYCFWFPPSFAGIGSLRGRAFCWLACAKFPRV